jgi:trans-aconitate methyltransferase
MGRRPNVADMARNGAASGGRHSRHAAMSGFSPEWLHLRESADQAARNPDVANAMAARFALREHVNVVDLGCGTGSNLRATSSLLPNRQSWRLVDSDPALLAAARIELSRWADQVDELGDGLHLTKGHAKIDVTFANINLATDLVSALAHKPALVTL